MIRRHPVFFAALLVLAALWFGARLSGLSPTQPAQAQTTKSLEARRWEYCTIVGVSWDSKRNSSSATIAFMTAAGRRFETLDGGSSGDPMSVALAKLGSEGWELVGQVEYNSNGSEHHPDTWLFKRPAL
jgi:hypothetical protein